MIPEPKEPGYYWIRENGEWEVAKRTANVAYSDSPWSVMGDESLRWDDFYNVTAVLPLPIPGQHKTECTPFRGTVRCIALEISSGISSLNMYPEPITPPGEADAAHYISETDKNVKHSIEHFRTAIHDTAEIERLLEEAHHTLIFRRHDGGDKRCELLLEKVRKALGYEPEGTGDDGGTLS